MVIRKRWALAKANRKGYLGRPFPSLSCPSLCAFVILGMFRLELLITRLRHHRIAFHYDTLSIEQTNMKSQLPVRLPNCLDRTRCFIWVFKKHERTFGSAFVLMVWFIGWSLAINSGMLSHRAPSRGSDFDTHASRASADLRIMISKTCSGLGPSLKS